MKVLHTIIITIYKLNKSSNKCLRVHYLEQIFSVSEEQWILLLLTFFNQLFETFKILSGSDLNYFENPIENECLIPLDIFEFYDMTKNFQDGRK